MTIQTSKLLDTQVALDAFRREHYLKVYSAALELTASPAEAHAIATQVFENAARRFADKPLPAKCDLYLSAQVHLIYAQQIFPPMLGTTQPAADSTANAQADAAMPPRAAGDPPTGVSSPPAARTAPQPDAGPGSMPSPYIAHHGRPLPTIQQLAQPEAMPFRPDTLATGQYAAAPSAPTAPAAPSIPTAAPVQPPADGSAVQAAGQVLPVVAQCMPYAYPPVQGYAAPFAPYSMQPMPGAVPMAVYPAATVYPMAQPGYAYAPPPYYPPNMPMPSAPPYPAAQPTGVYEFPSGAASAAPAMSSPAPASKPSRHARPANSAKQPATQDDDPPTQPDAPHAIQYNPQDTECWTPDSDATPSVIDDAPQATLPSSSPGAEPEDQPEDPTWAEDVSDKPSVALSLLNGILAIGGIGAVGFLLYQLGMLPKFF